jgi:hypothetical protein
VNLSSLSCVILADLSSHGSVAWELQRGKVGSPLQSLARRCGPSGFAPIWPHIVLTCWLFPPRPTKERPYELLGPWAFREAFYFFSGPRGYLSPTPAPVAEAFFGGMTKVRLAESVQDSKNGSEFTGGGRQCWGLVLKCYESRTRQHKMLNVNILRPSKHYFPKDIMIFGRRL